MPKYTLFANIDGGNLEAVAAPIAARLQRFVLGRQWTAGKPAVINENFGPCVITQTGTESLWHPGLRLYLPEIGPEPIDWFDDVVAVVEFLGTLHDEFGRSFSVSFFDETDHLEQLFLVATMPGEAGRLPVVRGVRYVPMA